MRHNASTVVLPGAQQAVGVLQALGSLRHGLVAGPG